MRPRRSAIGTGPALRSGTRNWLGLDEAGRRFNLLPTHAMNRFAIPTSRRLARELDHLFDAVWQGPASNTDRTPSADIRETPTAYVLRLDLPGIPTDGLRVAAEPGALLVTATRPAEPATDGEVITQRERPSGTWRRRFRLPDTVDLDAIAADYRDGVLTLTLPKSERAKPRTIEVRTA